MPPIILASQSPRRKMLLEWAEIPFQIIVKPTDEVFPPGLAPADAAIYIARNKALAVRATAVLPVNPPPVILAADTMVVLDEHIIGKPADRSEAIHTLQQLSGREHRVCTGVVLLHGETEITFAETTAVRFHPLTDEQISWYVDQYQPYDKAGAYAIQEWIGVVGIHSIRGDFYNVMGLPVSRVVQALQSINHP
ncbi:MAG TPA: Maf family nucleotide pyrophosphatase [Sediminibacterium sp.]|nr:Maf family nucleotide pyrophosphatase [Sediminibacterium sp.]